MIGLAKTSAARRSKRPRGDDVQRLDGQLDATTDSDLAHAADIEVGQRLFDRAALRIEDARLWHHVDDEAMAAHAMRSSPR
jgi:hypothetical protein